MTWTPHATVATIVEKDGKFLFVEELADGARVINQPAGHIEDNESIAQAALRETLEETGWHVELKHLVGIYTYRAPHNGVTYYRFCFACKALTAVEGYALDTDILSAQWLSYDEVAAKAEMHRSPLLMKCLDDYLAGKQAPMDFIYEHSAPQRSFLDANPSNEPDDVGESKS